MLNQKIQITGGWKEFKTRNGKIIRFFVPLGTKRKRRYCPTCKTTFMVCPYEEHLRLVHHFYCSNRCLATKGKGCPYLNEKIEPPGCGTIVGRHRTCGSCIYFSRKTINPNQKGLGICLAFPNTYVWKNSQYADVCEKYVNRTHKNR